MKVAAGDCKVNTAFLMFDVENRDEQALALAADRCAECQGPTTASASRGQVQAQNLTALNLKGDSAAEAVQTSTTMRKMQMDIEVQNKTSVKIDV